MMKIGYKNNKVKSKKWANAHFFCNLFWKNDNIKIETGKIIYINNVIGTKGDEKGGGKNNW